MSLAALHDFLRHAAGAQYDPVMPELWLLFELRTGEDVADTRLRQTGFPDGAILHVQLRTAGNIRMKCSVLPDVKQDNTQIYAHFRSFQYPIFYSIQRISSIPNRTASTKIFSD